MTVNSGATALFNGTQRLDNLNIFRGGTARMMQNGTAVLENDFLSTYPANTTNNLRGSVLDLADNDLIIHNGNLSAIAALLQTGYDAGKWDGESTTGALTGASILSSTAAADTSGTEALGYATVGSNTAVGQVNLSTFDGAPVSAGDVVVKFTAYGDANLDGTVDATDLAMLNNGSSNSLTGWSNGDFNYSSAIDPGDYTLFDNIYVAAPTNLTASVASPTEIDLTWTDHATASSGDVIYESTDGGVSFNPIDEISPPTSGSSNTYQATGLNAGTAYQFQVSSQGSYEESSLSNTASQTTTFEPPTLDVEGAGTVVEGQPYTLNLTAQYSDGEPGAVDHWNVNWGDGCSSNYYYPTGADPTQPLVVTHTFNSGAASPTVTITAVDSVNGSFTADPQTVAVTPIAPSFGSAGASGSSINLSWTNSSSISTGTTVLLSTDGTTFFQYGSASSGTSTTVSNLLIDSNYWVELLTEGANGESAATAAHEINLPYVQPTLNVSPAGPATRGQQFTLDLSATYADGLPQSDWITGWTVNWGDGSGVQTYPYPAGEFTSPTAYSSTAPSATVNITAIDAQGRSFSYQTQNLKLLAPGTQPAYTDSGPYSMQVGDGILAVGGEIDVPVIYNGPESATITYTSSDPTVIQVLGSDIRSDGLREVLLKGISIGLADIIGTDNYGSKGQSLYWSPVSPTIGSTTNDIEGATYAPGAVPSFTFSLGGAVSLTDVVIPYSTAGSTLPTSLMSPFTSGSITIPAGQNSVTVPFPVADDGVIAPTRVLVIALQVPGEVGPQATMNVENTDTPTVTMKGISDAGTALSDNAVIPLDPQGDNAKLTDIHMTTGRLDGQIASWTLTWNPNEFVMWSTKQIGTAGTDLAIKVLPNQFTYNGVQYGGALYGAHLGSTTETYTWFGAPPTDVYGQSISGSSDWDTTSVNLSITVVKAATAIVVEESRAAEKRASGTSNGAEIIWDSRPVTGITAGPVVIGEGVLLDIEWEGPSVNPGTISTADWKVARTAVSNYVQSGHYGTVDYLADDVQLRANEGYLYIHYFWVDPQLGTPVKNKVEVSGVIDGMGYDASTFFDVITPDSGLIDTPASDPPIGFGETGFVDEAGEHRLHFGNNDSPGATFAANVSAPSLVGGTAFLTQLVSDFIVVRTPTKFYYKLYNYVLDDGGKGVKYDGVSDHSAAGQYNPVTTSVGDYLTDIPSVNPLGLDPMANYVDRSFHAKTFLMWQPDGSATIPVALKEVDWQYSAIVKFNNAKPSEYTLWPSAPTAPVNIPAPNLPQWSDYAGDTKWKVFNENE